MCVAARPEGMQGPCQVAQAAFDPAICALLNFARPACRSAKATGWWLSPEFGDRLVGGVVRMGRQRGGLGMASVAPTGAGARAWDW